MVATSFVVPEDVRTLSVAARAAFGGGARTRYLAIDLAREHDLAIVGIDGYVHPRGRVILDAAPDTVLCLVAAPCQTEGQHHYQQHGENPLHAKPPYA